MTIKLGKLEFDWYFSYGAGNVIDFTENTVTQILGPNGFGKSSIPLVLEEICFNKNSKGISKADIPNRYGPGGTWGRLTFTKDNDTYVIEADRKSSIKVKLSKNSVDISSHTATATFKLIEELFGKDFKTFSQLVYQNTNTSLQFLSATDTNRKKFLMDLLQLEEYTEFFELFKDAVKERSNSIIRIEAQISTVESWLSNNRLAEDAPMEVLTTNFNTSENEQAFSTLSAELANIKKTNSLIIQNNKYHELLKSIDIAAINAIPFYEKKSYDEEQKELGEITGGQKIVQAHLDKLKKLADCCPTCEQPINSEFKSNLIAQEEDKLSSYKQRSSKLIFEISNIKDNNKNHDYKAEQIKNWEGLYQSIDQDLPRELFDKEILETKISDLSVRIASVKKEIVRIQSHNDLAVKHNSRLQVIKEQTNGFIEQLNTLQKTLAIEVDYVSDLELLKKSFSTNGLPAYKIENQVKELEELTNQYLAELSDGRFVIDFSVVSDKLNVNISDNGKPISIVALSSGELARVNTSTLLAIRKLMSSISKSKINVLFLDEVVSVLDEDGKQKLVEVLLEEDLNTYIVSHSWTHPLLAKLEVIKENNISRIEHA